MPTNGRMNMMSHVGIFCHASARLVPWVPMMVLHSDRSCQGTHVANGSGGGVKTREAKGSRKVGSHSIVLKGTFKHGKRAR